MHGLKTAVFLFIWTVLILAGCAGTYNAQDIPALVKSGNARLKMNQEAQAEKCYRSAVGIYKKSAKESVPYISDVAEAYCRIGDIYYTKYLKIDINGIDANAVREKLMQKNQALEIPAENFGNAISIATARWTIYATYMIGTSFVDMATAIERQPLFGNAAQQVASKIKLRSSLEKYYNKANTYYKKNIDWSRTQNIKDEYIDSSMNRSVEMTYRLGDNMEEVGRLLKNAPMPSNLSESEKNAFALALEHKWLEARKAALPYYKQAVQAASDLGITQSSWLNMALLRISDISADTSK